MKKKIILGFISLFAVSMMLHSGISYADNVLIEADKQSYDGANNMTTFEGNVKVGINNIVVKSPKASMRMGQDGKPQDAIFVDGAHAVKEEGNSKSEIKANIIRLSLLENKVKAEGNTNSWILENKTPVVTIKADSQEFDMATNIMTAIGGVVIKYKDLTTNSSKARINVDSNGKLSKVNLIGAAKIVQGNSIVNASNLIFNPVNDELIAIGNTCSQTILDDATKVTVWSNNQQYNKASNTLMSSGNVKIAYKDYVATGPKATFLNEEKGAKPNKILFSGRSKIQEGSRVVEANKITITVNPKNFIAEGNVKTKFTQLGSFNKSKNLNSSKTKKTKNTRSKSEKDTFIKTAEDDFDNIEKTNEYNVNNKYNEQTPSYNAQSQYE